ncbi:ABC transporter ATP-binding protein [Pyrofollis japonicus]|uniref:ABC transporter ATP-binding protein n=1 Tax=Pyrofollis japonicus TaxID=3060460 RepID=UPI00295C074C|nr:ABC transporter ATP-binding protein [Pyrofollis japonicus]BEP16918.1 ABC transporter ATP-binding protein [Pyrofollis japonicus]
MIEFRNVYKTYRRGRIEALKGASFLVPSGALAGFLGPNGSGKTTSLKLMVGLLHRDQGEILVKGLDPEYEAREVRAITGFLPEKPVYPPSVSVEHFLRHVARLRGVPWSDVRRIARLVGIEKYLDKPVSSLSRGYLQRLGLAQAILSQPEILLLDEPTANLDPIARLEILELISVLKKDLGATVIISSHILPELQMVIDYAVFINNGRVVDYGRLADLASRYGATAVYKLTVATEPRSLAKELLDLESVKGVIIRDEKVLEVHVDPRIADFSPYVEDLARRGLVLDYSVQTSYLDQLYRKAIGGS